MNLDHTRSNNDQKEYRLVTLESGLEVLLVSTEHLAEGKGLDLRDGKAAAAMCVQVGSFADPAEAEGLAHFLEHMVFMGSAKYPSENGYDQYVNSHGGGCNAFTEGEYTVFQFDITSEFFHKALDMFANCFISPLLKMEAAERELKAIESEFDLASMSDEVRYQQLFSHCAEEGHVLRKFSWGNNNSLSTVPTKQGVDMAQILRAFHRTHYLPQNMKLVMVAPKSLDALEADVATSFGAWGNKGSADQNDAIAWLLQQEEEEKNKSGSSGSSKSKKGASGKKEKEKEKAQGEKKKQKTADTQGNANTNTGGSSANGAIDPKNMKSVDLPTLSHVLQQQRENFELPVAPTKAGILTRIIPVKATHRLLLVWQLPSTQKEYLGKADMYLSHLIGHEGVGSLISHLKGQGLATYCEAGVSDSNFDCNSLFSLFKVQLVLTAKGVANWMFVVKVIMQYLGHVSRQGPQKWIFDELQRVAQLEYDYLDEEEEEEFAERLCVEMSPFFERKRDHLLSGSFLLWEWSPGAISSCLEALDPRKMFVSISSSSYKLEIPSNVSGGEGEADAEEVEGEGEGEGEDWEDVEEGSEDGDEGDEEDSKGGQEELQASEVLSPLQLLAKYDGPAEWADLVCPPAFTAAAVQEEKKETERAPEREPHFGALFWQDNMPEDLLSMWERAREGSEGETCDALALPPRNPFIPEDLSILPPESLPSSSPKMDNPLPPAPPDAQTQTQTQTQSGKKKKKRSDEEEPKALNLVPDPPPSKVVDEDGLRVWHVQEPRFPVPKVFIFLRLASTVSCSSVRNAAMSDLLKYVLYDSLDKVLYTASMAELSTSLGTVDVGLDIKVKGFSDKALDLLALVLRRLASPDSFITEKSFALQVERLRRIYSNDGLTAAARASTCRLVALKPSAYSSREKMALMPLLDSGPELDQDEKQGEGGAGGEAVAVAGSEKDKATAEPPITATELREYVREFLGDVSVEVLCHGNVLCSKVEAVCRQVFYNLGDREEYRKADMALEGLNLNGSQEGEGEGEGKGDPVRFCLRSDAYPLNKIAKLPLLLPSVLKQAPLNPDEPSSCVECYYQFGKMEGNLDKAVQLDLMEQILSEHFFDLLRTKQQLGYSVSCSARNTYGVIGFIFSVVSSSCPVAEVQRVILQYVQGVPRYLSSMQKFEFQEHVESLVNDKIQPPANLYEAAGNNAYAIQEKHYRFDTRLEEATILRAQSREGLSKFATQLLQPQTRRLLVVQATLESENSPILPLEGQGVEGQPVAQRQFVNPTDLRKGDDTEYYHVTSS